MIPTSISVFFVFSFQNFLNFVSTCVTWIDQILDAVQKETVGPRCEPRAPWIGKKKTLKSVRWFHVFHVYLMYGFCNFLIEVISERAHQDTPSEEARNEAEVSGFLDARIYLYFVHVPFWILKSKWEIPAFLAMLLWTCECFEAFETSLKEIIYLAFWQFQTERQAAELWKRSVALVGLWVFQKIAFRFAEKSRTFASWWREGCLKHEIFWSLDIPALLRPITVPHGAT